MEYSCGMQPTKPAPTSALCTEARLRHRHSRPNRLSRQVERGAGPELPHASTCRARSLASTCRARSLASTWGGLRSLSRPEPPPRPVLLSEIFYVLVARSADRRAEWIKRDCPPAESRRRTVCCSLTASDAFGRGSSRVTSRRAPCPAPGRPAFFLRPRQPLLWRSYAALRSWR